MRFRKIRYEDLTAKQQEIFNFQQAAAKLAEFGFNCIKLDDDWQGADFLAYHKDGDHTLKVQLKGRALIDKKYLGKDLYMCFPVDEDWFLIPHDELVEIVGTVTNALNTSSWLEQGQYHFPRLSRELSASLGQFSL